jgi:exosortase
VPTTDEITATSTAPVATRSNSFGLLDLPALIARQPLATNFVLLFLAVLWGIAWNEQRIEWSINDQYAYGWLIPVVLILLCAMRWPQRPSPNPPENLGVRWIGFGMLAALLAAQMPLRLIQEANGDWRLIAWLQAFQLAIISLAGVYLIGGTNWLRLFAFPILFTLFAVPWPARFEGQVIQSLMRGVAGFAAEISNLAGVAAMQRGNLIELSTGVVGVNEACSGVRSLQTSIVLAVLIGELHRFSFARRIMLVVLSIGIALAANVTRVLFLVRQAAVDGSTGVDRWHDHAGLVAVVICCVGVIVAASLLQIGQKGHRKKEEGLAETPANPRPPRLFPTWAAGAAILWLIGTEVGVEQWYQWHERRAPMARPWTVQWPAGTLDLALEPVDPSAVAMLRCDEAQAASWTGNGGTPFSAFFLEWKPGGTAVQLARSHRPDICIPGTGAELQRKVGFCNVDIDGIRLQFEHMIFTQGGRPLHTFHSVTDNALTPGKEFITEQKLSREVRMAAVRAGIRNRGQRSVQLFIRGIEDPAEAEEVFRQQISRIIVPLDRQPSNATAATAASDHATAR